MSIYDVRVARGPLGPQKPRCPNQNELPEFKMAKPAKSQVRFNEIRWLGRPESKQNGKMKPEKTRENRAAAAAQYKHKKWGSYPAPPHVYKYSVLYMYLVFTMVLDT